MSGAKAIPWFANSVAGVALLIASIQAALSWNGLSAYRDQILMDRKIEACSGLQASAFSTWMIIDNLNDETDYLEENFRSGEALERFQAETSASADRLDDQTNEMAVAVAKLELVGESSLLSDKVEELGKVLREYTAKVKSKVFALFNGGRVPDLDSDAEFEKFKGALDGMSDACQLEISGRIKPERSEGKAP